jgi:phytoene synthase
MARHSVSSRCFRKARGFVLTIAAKRSNVCFSSAPEPTRALVCPVCYLRREYSISWCRMQQRSAEISRVEPNDLAVCRALLRNGSRTFYAASFLLPDSLSVPATALYAFCRVADDAIDDGSDRMRSLERLRCRLGKAYAGAPEERAPDRALASVVERFALPMEIPAAMLEGFEWDINGRRYETLAALEDYALRVAGTVGAMMSWLMGARSRNLLARACDLGIAMQLTNIARDVGEDARAGRLYLPTSWLRSAGVDPDAWLQNPAFCGAVESAVARLLARADVLYRRSDAGINVLPLRYRCGIRCARSLYAAIGSVLERQGLNSVAGRAVVSSGHKLALSARSLAPYHRDRSMLEHPPTRAAAKLVDAIAMPLEASSRDSLEGGFASVLELFERLELRDRRNGKLASGPRGPVAVA